MGQQNNCSARSFCRWEPQSFDLIIDSEWRADGRREFEPVSVQHEVFWTTIGIEPTTVRQDAAVQFKNIGFRIFERLRRQSFAARPILRPFKTIFKFPDGPVGCAKAQPVLPLFHFPAIEPLESV